jgi:hypothetical protein
VVSSDGATYALKDLPWEIPDEMPCSISGVVTGTSQKELDWIQITSNPTPKAPFAPLRIGNFSEQALAVDQIRLILYAGLENTSLVDASHDENIVAQPYWDFSGHASNGVPFTILVPAKKD